MQEAVHGRRTSRSEGGTPRGTGGSPRSEGSTPRERNEDLFVVAVDFGTSYTGYAYAQRDSFETDPLKIYGMRIDGNQRLGKVPSSILLTPNNGFHSFGRSAELTYAEKCMNGKLDWRLFKNFKMSLYNTNCQKTTRDLVIKDCRGQPISAMTLFSLMFGHLKSTFFQQLEESIRGVGQDCVRWVITVPAIWDDSAKQFMREAAEKAGIGKTKITLALEPECAALYCGYMTQNLRMTLRGEMMKILGPGARYLLLDIGGGTVDITAHEVNAEFQYDELFAANGGPWGGENVNMAFQEYLQEIFSADTFSELCRHHPEDFYDLMEDFERKKRNFDNRMMKENSHVVIKLPYFLFNKFDPSTVSKDLAVVEHDKLKVPCSRMLRFFSSTLDEISRHIKNKLKSGDFENITSVILVGGFSVAGIVKDHLQTLFPKETHFHCPENAEVATLSGAVIYGQIQIRKSYTPQEPPKPRLNACFPVIHSRKSRYSYGIDSHVPFNPALHPTSKKFRDRSEVFCKDYFWVFLKAGTKLTQSKKGKMRTFTVDRDSNTLDVVIYRTENPDVRFVDDPACFQLGKLIVDMREGLGTKNREIKIGLQYNDTELSVYAINNKDEIIKTTFDMLDAV